ncbi:MAG TPA: roadblock/LC7 domain-containing protein [Polyangiaceae bacterium]|jgi:predicted regulator of Ras-like GTPase activity (Roadblock/LC7/MglB family)|nr:roadblock/LC7 domain-containing protein [Polyangiaceae bacterium]
MSFAQLFWILSATGAVLFFCAGLAAGTLKSQRASQMEQIEIARLQALVVELEHRTGNTNSSLPPAPLGRQTGNASSSLLPAALEGAGGTKTFQSILERLSKTKGIRAAVLGDAMGLPVAAIGEQSESLAGFCAFISQAASKAKDFLAFGRIRRIVIEDERVATLTACSITDTDIFLATLTSGPGPDLPRMVQLLNDVKSFMSQRSQA